MARLRVVPPQLGESVSRHSLLAMAGRAPHQNIEADVARFCAQRRLEGLNLFRLSIRNEFFGRSDPETGQRCRSVAEFARRMELERNKAYRLLFNPIRTVSHALVDTLATVGRRAGFDLSEHLAQYPSVREKRCYVIRQVLPYFEREYDQEGRAYPQIQWDDEPTIQSLDECQAKLGLPAREVFEDGNEFDTWLEEVLRNRPDEFTRPHAFWAGHWIAARAFLSEFWQQLLYEARNHRGRKDADAVWNWMRVFEDLVAAFQAANRKRPATDKALVDAVSRTLQWRCVNGEPITADVLAATIKLLGLDLPDFSSPKATPVLCLWKSRITQPMVDSLLRSETTAR
jgi:hypothetical protein